MNRAEKRRQKKLAKKTARNAEPGKNKTRSGGQKPLAIQESISLAMQHHNAGNLPEAEGIYRQILQVDPDQPDALHLLGVIANQTGNYGTAVDLITRALTFKSEFADMHYNLGNAFQELGKLDEAVASFRKALTIKPDYVEAHNNLGNALKDLGKLDEAVASYLEALAIESEFAVVHSNLGNALQELGRLDEAAASFRKALTIKPDYVEVHNNLGNALKDLGKLNEALSSYHKALAIKPDFAEAHYNIGNALQELGKLDEAVASFNTALTIKPDFAAAHSNLGSALKELGRLEEAFRHHRNAISLEPRNDLLWAGFATSLETHSFASLDDNLWQDLLHLLERPMVSSSQIVKPVIRAIRHHQNFSQILKATNSGTAEVKIAFGNAAGQLSSIPLLLRIMGLSPIQDLEIERMLTVLRHAMIEATLTGKIMENGLPFSTALALQCFTNEYAFFETNEEKAIVEQLQQQIAALVEKGHDVPPSFVATLGAYRPLYCFPWAPALCELEWADDIREVIERQISQPLEERALRSKIPCLTPIVDTVSQSVREQYEQNPYPRWIKPDMHVKGRAVGTVLQAAPLRFDLGDYVSPENPEILVAGCGTGQHALYTASRFSNAHVLAVDLSLSSLSYAMRKTRELGLSNIKYAQGDIIELTKLGKRFDIIESVGVLHHLDNPLIGWQTLVNILDSGGLMMIGLYSESARQNIISGRSLIAEKEYSTTAEDIRQCRQDIISRAIDGDPEMASICKSGDFFSLSECRDLIFHVQEHRFTLPQIEVALKTLGLKFLGFEMRSQRALRKFQESNPQKDALSSLSLWHTFELKNSDTFSGMYQFWCKKL